MIISSVPNKYENMSHVKSFFAKYSRIAKNSSTIYRIDMKPRELIREMMKIDFREENGEFFNRTGEIANAAGINPRYFSNFVGGSKTASDEVCEKIINAMNYTYGEYFVRAERIILGRIEATTNKEGGADLDIVELKAMYERMIQKADREIESCLKTIDDLRHDKADLQDQLKKMKEALAAADRDRIPQNGH